jgi:hypothetical protein
LASARAELVILKTGGQAEGEILNADRDGKQPVKLRTDTGLLMTIPAEQVRRIIVKSDLEKQYEALAPKTPDTIEGHWEMQEWCRQAELKPQRQKHLESILRLDPNHEGARIALGYVKHGNTWAKAEDWMRALGFVRYQGSWKSRQEVEIDVRDRQMELAQKNWMQKVKGWCDSSVRRGSQEAIANLKAIKDPAAARALLDVITEKHWPTELRVLCIDILSSLPGKFGTGAYIKLALEEPDTAIRDRALEELEKQRSTVALAEFTKLLTSKDNQKVLRAGYCLGKLGDTDATLPLIEALVTNHTYFIVTGTPGLGGASFGGGGSGMSQGQSRQVERRDEQNQTVLSALSSLNPGVDFGFNEEAWRKWYAQKYTTTDVNLRRDK